MSDAQSPTADEWIFHVEECDDGSTCYWAEHKTKPATVAADSNEMLLVLIREHERFMASTDEPTTGGSPAITFASMEVFEQFLGLESDR